MKSSVQCGSDVPCILINDFGEGDGQNAYQN